MSDRTSTSSQAQAAKKRKINGSASDSNVCDDNSTELSGVMKIITDMQMEMKSMKHKMNEMEKKLMKHDRVEKDMQGLIKGLEAVTRGLCEEQSSIDKSMAVAVEGVTSKCSDIEKSINARLRFHKQLIDNQQWEYSAEPPEPEDEDEVQLYAEMCSHMKSATTQMRRGESFDFYFDLFDGMYLGPEETIPHDDTMVPHWKEFTDALAQYRHYLNQYLSRESVTFCVGFHNVQLEPEVLEMLEGALAFTPFNELSLRYNDSGHNLVSFVTKALQNNEHCKTLCMAGNQFESGDFIEAKYNLLWETVNNHSSLTTLNLDSSFPSENQASLLRDALSRLGKLTRLILCGNGISGEKAICIANFLETNPSMLELHLADNEINDADAAKITEALAQNNTLRFLSIYGNSMTQSGASILRRAFFGDETRLNSVAASNHTCEIMSNWPETFCNRCAVAPKLNRRRKLYHTLDCHYRKSTGVLELIDNELPNNDKTNLACKLMPRILGSIQLYNTAASGKIHPLSIVYEIMKGWRRPLLYEKD